MGAIRRKYGVACTIDIILIEKDVTDFISSGPTFATNDCRLSKDGAAYADTNSNPSYVARGHLTLALTATEMQFKRGMVSLIDQSGTKVWEDNAVLIETYGHPNAQHNAEEEARSIVSASAVSGTLSQTQMTTDLTEVTDNHYVGRTIIWTSGVLADQQAEVTAYNGTSKMLTFTSVTDNPSAGDTFYLV